MFYEYLFELHELISIALRLTSGGNLLPNFFMLVEAQADLPILSNVYPSGTHPFEPTNTFSFTVTTLGSTFPANGVTVNLDGFDVTSNLVVTGSSTPSTSRSSRPPMRSGTASG